MSAQATSPQQERSMNARSAEALREIEVREEACRQFRKNVTYIIEQALEMKDFKLALRAQELLARHYGLLPNSTRYRKVPFLGKRYSENQFEDIIRDLCGYMQEMFGQEVPKPSPPSEELYTPEDWQMDHPSAHLGEIPDTLATQGFRDDNQGEEGWQFDFADGDDAQEIQESLEEDKAFIHAYAQASSSIHSSEGTGGLPSPITTDARLCAPSSPSQPSEARTPSSSSRCLGCTGNEVAIVQLGDRDLRSHGDTLSRSSPCGFAHSGSRVSSFANGLRHKLNVDPGMTAVGALCGGSSMSHDDNYGGRTPIRIWSIPP